MGKASRNKRGRGAVNVKRQRNLFPLIVTLSVLAITAVIAAFFVVGTKQVNDPAAAPAPASVNQTNGGIVLGNGKTDVTEYLDFGCPHCGEWFAKSHATLEKLVKEDQIKLTIHPISILDNAYQGTKYSTRSANAAYCVADQAPDSVYSFISALFKNQPTEGTKGLTDAKLVSLAKSVRADKATKCITSGQYEDYVEARTKETPVQPGTGGISTPTIQVDGEFIPASVDPQDIAAVARAKK